MDPNGLWSIKFSRYFGWGAGLSLGHNPETGRTWAEIEAGVGVEAGFVFDPNDTGDQYCDDSFGLEAEWSLMTNGLGVQGRTESVGLNVATSPENNLFNPELSTNVLGVQQGPTVGGHVGVYGRLVF